MVFNFLFNCVTLDISGDDLECFTRITVFLSFQNDIFHYYHGHLGCDAVLI
jgi:hypothetical protein